MSSGSKCHLIKYDLNKPHTIHTNKTKIYNNNFKNIFIYFQLLHFIWRDVRTRRRNAPRKPCPGARTPWRWSRTTRTSASPPHKKSFKKCARKLLLMTSQKHLPFDQIFLQVMNNFKFARFFYCCREYRVQRDRVREH